MGFLFWLVVFLSTFLSITLVLGAVVFSVTLRLKIYEKLLIFQFLLVKMEWRLLSSLLARLRTRNLGNFLCFVGTLIL